MSRLTAPLTFRSVVAGTVCVAVLSNAALFSTGLASAATTGSLALASGQSAYAVIDGVSTTVAANTFTVPSTTARPVYLGLQFRSDQASEGYRTRIAITADGSVRVGISRVRQGRETVLLSEQIALTVEAGDQVHVEGSVTGTSPAHVQVRAWVGAIAPEWQKSFIDSSASRVSSGTTVRAWGYLSGRAPAGDAAVAYSSVLGSTAAASTPASSTPAEAPSALRTTGKPSATNTGPVSKSLQRHDGDITVTQAGTVLEGLDIHGFVRVKAANVVIRDSIIRGGEATGNIGLITNYGYDNLLVEDVYVKPQHQSVWIDGIKGWDFALNRVHVEGGVDNVKIHGDNVTITNSLLEKTVYYAEDPNQGGGPTHNDNVQILKGTNLTIAGNTIRETTNFPIMNGAEQGDVDAQITNNWLDGGHCTVKLMTRRGWNLNTVITGNTFGPNRKIAECVIQAHTDVTAVEGANTFEQTGRAVSIYWNNA